MVKSRAPATDALQKLLKSQDSESSLSEDESRRVSRRGGSLKRPSSHMESLLDMTSLLEASEVVDGSSSFPNIEWPTLENNYNATDLCAPQTKKRCSEQQLSRCKKNLQLLPPRSTSDRTVSYASMY